MDADAAFAAFAEGNYAALVRTAYLLTGDRGHAEDLVQQCLLTTYRAWLRLDSIDAAGSYTRTSMVRLATRWGARRWRGEVPTGALPDRRAADPADAIDSAVLVHSALAALPAQQRAVLVLRYFEDRSEAEVAAIMGCSVGTVKSRASRGLAALRAHGLLVEADHG